MNLVKAYGSGSPALVIVNKCDQHPLDLDERGLREKFPFIREFVRTDCWEEIGIEKLREAVQQETDALPDLRTPFPEAWFAIKKKLEDLPDDCITYDEYKNLCSANEEKNAGNQEVLIGFLNDLGSVLHFSDDPQLCDFGVLKPDWVTQGIYGLLNADSLKTAGAVLKMPELSTLLDKTRYPKHRHDHLMKLMKKFELCFEMPHTEPSTFLIPELLPKDTPELPAWKAADTLGFEYHYNILPEGLLPRFIVRTHTLSEGCARWRHGVELRQGKAKALVRADVQEKRVTIAVRGPGRQPRDLLAVIRQQFEEIHTGIKGLFALEKVPVPGYPEVKLLDYRSLLVREAREKTTVEFETATESIELPLGKLLDNFEELASRRARATNIINIHYGGKLIMSSESYDFSEAQITNSVVGAHMQNINLAIQQLPIQRAALRTGLEELKTHAEPLLNELPKEMQEEAAQNLEDFVKEAAKDKPRKSFLSVTSIGLIDAAKTVAAMAGPIIATVDKLRPLLGF